MVIVCVCAEETVRKTTMEMVELEEAMKRLEQRLEKTVQNTVQLKADLVAQFDALAECIVGLAVHNKHRQFVTHCEALYLELSAAEKLVAHCKDL